MAFDKSRIAVHLNWELRGAAMFRRVRSDIGINLHQFLVPASRLTTDQRTTRAAEEISHTVARLPTADDLQ